jgi:hypothetical protein
MAITRNTKLRAVKQEALREQLQAQGHLQHVVDLVDKIRDENIVIDQEMVARYKITIDTKLKLIGKYCPDLKAVEMTGELQLKPHEDWLDILDGK